VHHDNQVNEEVRFHVFAEKSCQEKNTNTEIFSHLFFKKSGLKFCADRKAHRCRHLTTNYAATRSAQNFKPKHAEWLPFS